MKERTYLIIGAVAVILLVLAVGGMWLYLNYSATCNLNQCGSYPVMRGCKFAWIDGDVEITDHEFLSCIHSCEADTLCQNLVRVSQQFGIMSVTHNPACDQYVGTYDENSDCKLSDFEFLDIQSGWSAGLVDDFCFLYFLNIWQLNENIPQCEPGVTPDPCDGVDCPNYCDWNSWKYGGWCSGGSCYYTQTRHCEGYGQICVAGTGCVTPTTVPTTTVPTTTVPTTTVPVTTTIPVPPDPWGQLVFFWNQLVDWFTGLFS